MTAQKVSRRLFAQRVLQQTKSRFRFIEKRIQGAAP
jgi:hypothetical protein